MSRLLQKMHFSWCVEITFADLAVFRALFETDLAAYCMFPLRCKKLDNSDLGGLQVPASGAPARTTDPMLSKS